MDTTGNTIILQLLLAYGADANAGRTRTRQNVPGVEGSTPLHFAAANGHMAAVRLLLENGARPAPTDKDKQTPEALALASGHDDIALVLAQHSHSSGRVEPGSVRDLGYVPDLTWGGTHPSGDGTNRNMRSRALSTASSASFSMVPTPNGSPRLTPSASPALMPVIPRSSNGTPSQLRSKATSSPVREAKRPSLPYIFEKAVSPAASLRAVIQSHVSMSADDDEPPAPAAAPPSTRHQLLNSKKSISAILRRAAGIREPSPPPSDIPPLRDVSREATRTPPTVIPTKQLSPGKARLFKEKQRAGDSTPPVISSLPKPASRLRSSSISGLVPAVDDRGRLRPPLLRARANSEAQPPENNVIRGINALRVSPAPSPGTSPSASSPSSGASLSIRRPPSLSNVPFSLSAGSVSSSMAHPVAKYPPGESYTTSPKGNVIAAVSPPFLPLAAMHESMHPPLRLEPQAAQSSENVAAPASNVVHSQPSTPTVPMSAEILTKLLESQGTGVDEYGHAPLAALLAEVGEKASGSGGSTSGGHGHV
ncbi:hypothetical protein MCUN1_000728 [Malassezia cuniculi]|uniref:Ankyrin n=1 Tax=Malassezia cuniculi TaxID=948313 RepID=A0AAF0ESU9_9BASI|nr:hypothetical protein MCUN1_000728 [Malassezia cuniculi]